MIDINDYNREDLIASCLMEAAEVMSESYGRNGVYTKYIQDRYKAEKAKNDEQDKNVKKKYDMYTKAGYPDKAPKLSDRSMEKEYLHYVNNDHITRKHGDDLNMANQTYGRRIASYNALIHNNDKEAYNKLYEAERRADANAAKKAQVNKRINERAERARKAMGESAYDHLDFADAVLDILNDYDY